MPEKTEKLNKIKNEKGMTLLEVMVAIFIFSLIMVAVVQIFGSSASGYRNAVKIQRNLEDAQFAMNEMTKTLRTSTVVSSAGLQTDIKIFDYSRPTDDSNNGNCIEFKFDTNKIIMASSSASDSESCGNMIFGNSDFNEMTAGKIENMKFEIVPSASGGVGKVTISMEVCADSGGICSSTGKVQIQSTVSLRDYNVSFQ